MKTKNINIHMYFYWLILSSMLSFFAKAEPLLFHTGIGEVAKRYLNENIAPFTYEASIYLVFVLAGSAGFFYVYRNISEIKLHTKALFNSLNVVLRIGGVFSGVIVGSILYFSFFGSFKSIPLGVAIFSYLILFTMIPPWIMSIILGEVEYRRNNMFNNKTSLTAFRLICLFIASIGLYGLFDISTRFIA